MSVLAYQEFKNSFLANPCMRCRLCETRTQIVFDRGNNAAKILLIGEAPGAEEDKTGKCFVGRSGKLLDKVMASVGIDTASDVLIANIIKCRPPENRKPKPDEGEECFPFLKKQIFFMKPEVIVMLGATAATYLFPEKKWDSMEKNIGNFFEYEIENLKIPCLLLYHPAYLLYSPKKRPEMMAHAKKLIKFIRES